MFELRRRRVVYRLKKFSQILLILVFGLFLNISIGNGIVFIGIDDGLVAYYSFNENTNDESVNWNHGSMHGATLTVNRFGNTESA